MAFNQQYQAGSFIKFFYRAPTTQDPNKEVFVLHPNWQGEVHGIDLKRVTPAQRDVLQIIMDPEARKNPAQATKYPLVQDILRRMPAPEDEIKNPLSFYQRFVKPFMNRADVYRKYNTGYMFNVQVLKESKVQGAVMNPKPLFKRQT